MKKWDIASGDKCLIAQEAVGPSAFRQHPFPVMISQEGSIAGLEFHAAATDHVLREIRLPCYCLPAPPRQGLWDRNPTEHGNSKANSKYM